MSQGAGGSLPGGAGRESSEFLLTATSPVCVHVSDTWLSGRGRGGQEEGPELWQRAGGAGTGCGTGPRLLGPGVRAASGADGEQLSAP